MRRGIGELIWIGFGQIYDLIQSNLIDLVRYDFFFEIQLNPTHS